MTTVGKGVSKLTKTEMSLPIHKLFQNALEGEEEARESGFDDLVGDFQRRQQALIRYHVVSGREDIEVEVYVDDA